VPTVSVYDTTTPAGTFTKHVDGNPSIKMGQNFYYPLGTKPAGTVECIGARFWCPAGHTLPATVTLSIHMPSFDGSTEVLDDTPMQSKSVATTAGTAGWVEVLWDTPVTMPDEGIAVLIGAQFSSVNNYQIGAGMHTGFPSGATVRVPSVMSTGLSWWPTDANDALVRSVSHAYYRIGTNAHQYAANGAGYGIDILVSEPSVSNNPPVANAGADQSVTTGTQVTLNGSGSTDSDGTIASYSWVQTSGDAVTLSGSGATRTFTPSTAGVRVFTLTVTDDDGATDDDTVTITASLPSPLTIAQENALSGLARNNWLDGVEGDEIPGFARSTYYLPGQTAQFSIDYTSAFEIEIWRLGHYGGSGARRVVDGIVGTPVDQPAPVAIPGGNGAVTCAAWSVSDSWAIPANATPGWYWALLRGSNNTDFGHILFCVSDQNAKKPVVIVTGDATWHCAYNGYGGNNVYGANEEVGNNQDRALCSTYDKPVYTITHVPQTHFMNNTYPLLKWSESLGFEAGVTTIEQIKNDPTILDGRDLIVWSGHNEYIPQSVMDKTKALIAGGQNMVNAAANDFFWRVKFTDGAFDSANNGRVMWCKKDSLAGPTTGPDADTQRVAGEPFTTEADWTGTWQDTRWSLREPSSEFFADQFIANGIRSDAVAVPFDMKTVPAWRNCPGVQALTSGQVYSFTAGTLGMEWDEPMGTLEVVPFSSKTVVLTGTASDANGANYNNNATPTHSFLMVRNGSAFIANFNSDQWGWALDALHLRGSAAADVNARQMMLNVFTDLGATANSSSVTAAGLTQPTAVSVGVAYFGDNGSNVAPVANAGPDQSVATGVQVTLNGSESTDSDGTIVSYSWLQTSGPAVTLSGSGATRTFTPSQAGTYTFALTVTDDGGATDADIVNITASAGAVTLGVYYSDGTAWTQIGGA
jgi:hypothetical protein